MFCTVFTSVSHAGSPGWMSLAEYPGSIYVTITVPMERSGGTVDNTGWAVPTWVRDFLLDPHQALALGKLARSGASERHAYLHSVAGSPASSAPRRRRAQGRAGSR